MRREKAFCHVEHVIEKCDQFIYLKNSANSISSSNGTGQRRKQSQPYYDTATT